MIFQLMKIYLVIKGKHYLICSKNTFLNSMIHSPKKWYKSSCKFVPLYNPYKKQWICFDGTIEVDPSPLPPTGDEVLKKVEGITLIICKLKEQ